jgi:hypothetical protein
MSTISTSGISPHSIIRSEHLLRIINALSNTSNIDIKISGSLVLTGSESISGSLNVTGGITGSLFGTSSFALTSSITTAISGSTGYIPMFTGSRALKNSNIYQDSSGRVGIGISVPQSCASLEITSNGSKSGLVLPIVDTTGSIASPASGLMVFDISVKKVAIYEGTTWKYLRFD